MIKLIPIILLVAFNAWALDIDVDNNNAVDIAYGGTNATTSAGALTNLGAAASSHAHSELQSYDADLDAASSATGAGNSKYFGTDGSGTVGFHTLTALGFDVDAPGAAGALLKSNGSKWERVTSLTGVTVGGLTASRAVYSDASGNLTASTDISDTELTYLNGVTSNIQTQFSSKGPAIFAASVNPQDVYDNDATNHRLTIVARIPAAFTITRLYVSCDANPTTEPTLTFKECDAGVGCSSASTIEAVTTTDGVANITSSIDDASIASGKKIVVEFSDPDNALVEVAILIEGTY